MTLDPGKLKATASSAQKRKAAAEKKRKAELAEEREDRIEAFACELFDRVARDSEQTIKEAAKQGEMAVMFPLGTSDPRNSNYSEQKAAFNRAQEALIEYFEVQGLKVKRDNDHMIDYVGSMDPSPVDGGTVYRILVSWD